MHTSLDEGVTVPDSKNPNEYDRVPIEGFHASTGAKRPTPRSRLPSHFKEHVQGDRAALLSWMSAGAHRGNERIRAILGSQETDVRTELGKLISRSQWLESLALQTKLQREVCARDLERMGRAFAREERKKWRESGRYKLKGGIPAIWPWHSSRAQGLRSMFGRVASCGTESSVNIRCRDCGDKRAFVIGCGAKFFCATCRKEEIRKKQQLFERRRQGLITAAARAGVYVENIKNFARALQHLPRAARTQAASLRASRSLFSERFITLTIPHNGNLEQRCAELDRTWRIFTKEFSKKQRERYPEETHQFLAFDRVFEWTPGSDGQGHPHIHLWHFGPYISRGELRDMWSRAHTVAVSPKGRSVPNHFAGEGVIPCNVDVRTVHGGTWNQDGEKKTVASELCKYLVKDWHEGTKLAPDILARLWKVLHRKRQRQASLGFAPYALIVIHICECCGFETERLVTWIEPLTLPDPKQCGARAPPALVRDEIDPRTRDYDSRWWDMALRDPQTYDDVRQLRVNLKALGLEPPPAPASEPAREEACPAPQGDFWAGT